MARFVGRHIAPEMLGLWLLESALSFGLAYALLTSGSVGAGWQAHAANHALVLALTTGFIAFLIGLYRPEAFSRTRGLLWSTALGGLAAFPAAWMVSKAFGLNAYWPVGYDALRPMKIVLIWIGALFAIRLLFLAALRSNLFLRRVAVLGGVEDVSATIAAIRAGGAGFIELVGSVSAQRSADDLRNAKAHILIVPEQAREGYALVQADCARHGIRVETDGGFWERQLRRVHVDKVDASWIAALDQGGPSRAQLMFSRAMDIMISLALLALTLPLMTIVALLVRWESPGPVLFRQERVGLGGRPFTLLKFRSMRVDAEANGPAWAQQRDPRVTRIGSLMRRTRVDELPQLLNVLRGEMSFIGPRPERPHFVGQLAKLIPHYAERARVKPGLTGWAQVNYPYGASVEDAKAKLSYDLYYVKNRSPFLDLLILLATVRVILFQEGAR